MVRLARVLESILDSDYVETSIRAQHGVQGRTCTEVRPWPLKCYLSSKSPQNAYLMVSHFLAVRQRTELMPYLF